MQRWVPCFLVCCAQLAPFDRRHSKFRKSAAPPLPPPSSGLSSSSRRFSTPDSHGSRGQVCFFPINHLLQHSRRLWVLTPGAAETCRSNCQNSVQQPLIPFLQAEPAQAQQMAACCSCLPSPPGRTSGFTVHCFGMQTCKSLEPVSLVVLVLPEPETGTEGLLYCGCVLPLKLLLLLEVVLLLYRRYIMQHWRTTAVSRRPAWQPWRAPPRMPLRCLASSPSVTTGEPLLAHHLCMHQVIYPVMLSFLNKIAAPGMCISFAPSGTQAVLWQTF